MDNAGSALKWAMQELSRSEAESPRLTAELLLAHALGCERVQVLAHSERPLSPADVERFAALIRRRANGEPHQYITGAQEFYGLPFRVTPAVLIPRPETEILVERATLIAKDLGSRPMLFADVGTGSGCIAVSFAHEIPEARGWAIDISVDALAVARENAASNGVSERIAFLRGDFLEAFRDKPFFDLILSNPPYIALDDAASLPAVVRDHEPAAALFGGNSGLDSYRRLIPQAASRLTAGGRLILEIGMGMRYQVQSLLEQAGFLVQAIAEDLQGIPRCILARRNHG